MTRKLMLRFWGTSKADNDRSTIFKSTLFALSLSLSACVTSPPVEVDLEISNITVIDPETESVQPNQTVLISDGRIVDVLPTKSARAIATQSIDGDGRYIIPGLMDMHAHAAVAPVAEHTFKLMIVNGVTGIRDMSADCWEPRGAIFLCIDQMRAYADQIESGQIPGPRLLKLSSPIVQSAPTWQLPKDPDPLYSPISAEQGTQLVGYLKERGVDLIKVYDRFHPDAYRAILAEAGNVGLEVSGHLPIFISSMEASNLGQRTIEHARDLLTDCSDYGQTYRSGNMAMLEGVEGASWPKQDDLRVQSVTTFDPDICATLLSTMIENNTYYVPTHGTREMDVRARDASYRDDPRLRYMSDFLTNDWQNDLDNTAAIPEEKIGAYKDYYDHGLLVTKLAIDAGVSVMIGTDANDTMIFPGFGVHDEMARFADAGVSPMQILRAATTVPAQYMERSDDFGGVSSGKIADLVILDANPLENIKNSTRMQAVIFGGRVYDKTDLDALLASLEQ